MQFLEKRSMTKLLPQMEKYQSDTRKQSLQLESTNHLKNILENTKSCLELVQESSKTAKNLNSTSNQTAIQSMIINKCDLLLQKCNLFHNNTQQCTKEMETRREQALETFESKWIDWEYRDIVFWFKVKLSYFDAIRASDDRSNSNNEDNKEAKESDLLSIDFENVIYKNLESQRIRGKFLSLINRSDLRNLGFELFEHQCKIHKQIEKLVEKYPIPIEDDPINRQIEGLNVEITQSKEINEVQNKYDEKYICPITKELMKCPVIAYDGGIYEKQAIIKYLAKYHTTPKYPNEKLSSKEEIEQMIQMLLVHLALETEIKNLRMR